MKSRSVFIFLAIIILVSIAYIALAEGHREDLGQLETYTYDASEKYCSYTIETADPDAGFYKMGDTICIVCTENWPDNKINDNVFCWARITFKSASGLVTYKAKTLPSTDKVCTACTKARQYYKKP